MSEKLDRRVPLAVACLASLTIAVAPSPSRAACNTPPPMPGSATAMAVVPYMSNGGSIDSPFLVPGQTRTISSAGVTNADSLFIAFLPPAGSGGGPALVRLSDTACNPSNKPSCAATIDTDCQKTTISFDASAKTITFVVPKVLKGLPSDDIQRVGQARLVATTENNPCWLADAATPNPCSATSHPGADACFDVLTSPGDPSDIDAITALPEANDFSNLCATGGNPPQCKGYGAAWKNRLEMAVDAHGNLLIPMSWKDLLANCPPGNPHCQHRDITAFTTLPATATSPSPIDLGGDGTALATFNESGRNFTDRPPKFAANTNADALDLLGDVDEPFSVLRIRQCKTAGQLPCAAKYFDLAYKVKGGVGPVVIQQSGPNSGFCGDGTNTCTSSATCATPPCVKVGGSAGGFHIQTVPPPPPPPPPSPPPGGGANFG